MIVPLTRPASEFQLTRSWILKVFGTVVRSDAAKELHGGGSRIEFSIERHEPSNRGAHFRFLESPYLSTNARFCFRQRTLRINSEAGVHARSPLGATPRAPFSP